MWPRIVTVIIALFTGFISTKLGRCAKCMRLSLRSAVLGWSTVAISDLLLPGTLVQHVLLICAVSLTLLWSLHVIAYGARIVVAAVPLSSRSFRALDASPAPGCFRLSRMSRRGLVGTFGRALGLAVFASLSVSLPVGAQGLPNGSGCKKSSMCASGCCDPASLTCVDSNNRNGCCAPPGPVQC
jgi:hypothetical protein